MACSNPDDITNIRKDAQSEANFCTPCEFKKVKNIGISWCAICEEVLCEQCSKCHESFKATSNHKLVPIHDKEKCQLALQETTIFHCNFHRERPVEVLCVDHSEPCCALCATLSHRKCEHVISIEEAASDGVKVNEETTELLTRLHERGQLLEDVTKNRKENEITVESEVTDIKKCFKQIKGEIVEHLDQIENMILSELNASKDKIQNNISEELINFTTLQGDIQKWKTLLAGALRHGTNAQCLILVHKIKPLLNILEGALRQSLKKINVVSLRYRKYKILGEFREFVQSFGDIYTENLKLGVNSGKIRIIKTNLREGKIQVVQTMQVANSGSSSGIFVDDYIVFAVYNTKVVAKYDQDGNLLNELKVPQTPYDISLISGTKIAVTGDKGFLFMIESKDMTLITKFCLSGIPVYGLCSYDENYLIVACSSGDTLTWVDMTKEGKGISAGISIATGGQTFFVSAFGNNDYIYGEQPNSVSYVVNNTKTFTYTNNQLANPRGIGIDDEGNFYIASLGSSNIHQIFSSGELIRIIPASAVGVGWPWTVRFNPGTNQFLVTCQQSGKATICKIV